MPIISCSFGRHHLIQNPTPNEFTYTVSSDTNVRKIDQNGDSVWTFTGHTNIVQSLAVDDNGYVYTTSNDHTVKKIDPNGSQVWSVDMGSGPFGIDVDTNSNVFVVLPSPDTLIKLDSSGNQVWSYSLPGTSDDAGWYVGVGPDGNIYGQVFGLQDNGTSYTVLWENPRSNVKWSELTFDKTNTYMITANNLDQEEMIRYRLTDGNYLNVSFSPSVGECVSVNSSNDVFFAVPTENEIHYTDIDFNTPSTLWVTNSAKPTSFMHTTNDSLVVGDLDGNVTLYDKNKNVVWVNTEHTAAVRDLVVTSAG